MKRVTMAQKMSNFTGRAPNFGGYRGADPVTHRLYNRATSIRRFKRDGAFANRWDGSGHRAGERWGEEKNIDPKSQVRRYSKNSPSFDEGVYTYKKIKGAKEQMMNDYLARQAAERALISKLP